MSICTMCPRRCGVDRTVKKGACMAGEEPVVSRVSKHMWEEPCISGTNGSGTVFFSGCTLKCVFCQNAPLSREGRGETVPVNRLAELFLEIRDSGAHNINLVTPTHFTYKIAEALSLVKNELGIPVVWNSGGYELPETLSVLDGLVDIYMPDFKYVSPELSLKYSGAADYAEKTSAALKYMYGILGHVLIGPDGLMKRGILVRHLVLPGCRKDSVEVLKTVAGTVPARDILLGLMAQYTPDFYTGSEKNLQRRVTTFEYESVREEALKLGFDGYMQSPTAATAGFTPEFSEKLLIDL